MVSGQFADRYGRRAPFLWAAFLTCVISFSTAFVQSILPLIVLRALMGILVGFFGPLGVTLLTEVTPREVRGRYMSLITVSVSIGQLFGLTVGYFTLDNLSSGNWRLLIIITSLPGLLAWAVGYFFLD